MQARNDALQTTEAGYDTSDTSIVFIRDVGDIDYESGMALQRETHEHVLASRDANAPQPVGTVLFVEHVPPVITVSRRHGAQQHLLATPEQLTKAGVTIAQTDRGGDITYHGPGQLVAYPILDLNRLHLNLHAYLRFLEQVVIDVSQSFGVDAHRDQCATGVWVGGDPMATDANDQTSTDVRQGGRKICAIGVRVRKWITMHGLALNITTNLEHFKLIVPCGLAGRPVTSLQRELGDAACPSMTDAKRALAHAFIVRCKEARDRRAAQATDV